MKPQPINEKELSDATRREIYSKLFLDFVMQHAQTALALLGKMPGVKASTESEPIEMDPASAKALIDQLEMIREKTRGNLSAEERELLDRSIYALHKDFLNVMETQSSSTAPNAPDHA